MKGEGKEREGRRNGSKERENSYFEIKAAGAFDEPRLNKGRE